MMRQSEKWFTDRFFDLFFPTEGFGAYSCQLPESIQLGKEINVVVCGAGAGVLEATIAKDLCKKTSVINVAFIDISDEPFSMLHWILQHHEVQKSEVKAAFGENGYPSVELGNLYHVSILGCRINYAFFVENLEFNPNPQNHNFRTEEITNEAIRNRYSDFMPRVLNVICGGHTTVGHEIDVVVMSMVLQHLSYWRSLIVYCNRYLSEKGFFAVNEFSDDDYLLGFDVSNAVLSAKDEKESELRKSFVGLVDRQFSILSDNNEICATNIGMCRHFFEYWGCAYCEKTAETSWKSIISGDFVKALFTMPMFSPFKRYNALIGIDEERISQSISEQSEYEIHFSLRWYLFGKLNDLDSAHFDVISQEQTNTDLAYIKLRRYISEVFEMLQANTTIFSLMRNESLTGKIIPELIDLLGRFCLFRIGDCGVDQLTIFINGCDAGYVLPLVNSARCGEAEFQIQMLKEVKEYNISLEQSGIPSSNELFFNVYKDVFTCPFAVILGPCAKGNGGQFRDDEFHDGLHYVRLECDLDCESFSCKTALNQNGLSLDVFKLLYKQIACMPDKKCALIPCFRENIGIGKNGVGREFTASLIVGYRQDDDAAVQRIEEKLLPFYSWLMRSAIEFSGIGVAIDFVRYERRVRVANTHSAVGSIMSRNGSHNIGSHVLAALSHNVGTMPDDRVLYQYIQHRMDYIATATTDRPQWRQPTMMVAGLMKEFLKQRHLLDHVCGSEELHAYKFQGQSVDDNANNAIRIHIRRVKDEVEKWEQRVFFAKTTKKNDGKVSDGNVFDFIDYAQGEIRNLDTDIALAIPGGVVGNHAFYTIIENVLRNAAKHEWAESLRVWKMACELLGEDVCLKEYAECQPRHLDVYVDFRDDPSNGKVQCRIWNDRVVSVENTAKIKTAILMRLIKNSVEENGGSRWKDRLLSATKTLTYLYSRLKKRAELKNGRSDFEGGAFYQSGNELYALIKRRAEDVEKRRATLSDDEKLRFDSDLELRNSLVAGLCNNFIGAESSVNSIRGFLYEGMVIGGRDLRIGLEEKIRQSFIDENSGSLRKENWGIAEMRISAGYLQCSETGQIGGLPGAGDPCKIIWPVLVKNDDGDECVAYRFDVDKPKLLLVVLKSKCDDILTLRQNSMCYGVDFMCRSEIESGKAYPYSYILFEELDNELKAQLVERKVMLPYRQLYASIDEPCGALEEYVSEYSGTFFRELASKLAALKGSKEGAAKVCYQLLEEVYAAWLVHIQNRVFLQRNEGRLPNLVIDMGTDSSSGSGKTLVSRYELLKFVFENSFNAAIRSFLAENGPDTVALETRTETRQTCLSRESGLIPPKVAAVLYAVAQMRTRNVAKDFSKRVKALWSVPEIVDEQLMSWMREVIGSAKKVFINLDEISPEWDRYWSRKFNLISQRDVSIEVGAIEDFDDEDCDYWLGRFENYISSTIVDQAEAFLSKYEERYVTLPVIPERKNDDAGCAEGNSSPSFSWGKLNLIVTSESKVRDRAVVNNDICYFRHGTKTQANIGDNYYEPLSGSQSTFNAFASLRRDLKRSNDAAVHCEIVRFLTRLVENAAMRVLIVDERVAKFVRDHSEVGDILGGLRIAVADDTELNVMRMFSSERIDDSLLFSGVELKKFEIVVIHQGIIDKLLHGHEDKIKVKVWLDGLVKKLHYVVITTGRGSPANIPDTARVLPYSVIENSILQRYPEKILLVDAIMNILPVRKQKES